MALGELTALVHVGSGVWLGGFLWPLTVITLWINLVADQFANSKRPNQHQNQSALLLSIQTIQLNQRGLSFYAPVANRLARRLPSGSGHHQAMTLAKSSGVSYAKATQHDVCDPKSIKCHRNPDHHEHDNQKRLHGSIRLTKKAEPPPTRGVDCNRSGNGGWLRRLVRRIGHISR